MELNEVSRSSSTSKTKIRTTTEERQKIIEMHKAGMSIAKIARKFGKPPSTIHSIVKRKNATQEVNVEKSSNVLTQPTVTRCDQGASSDKSDANKFVSKFKEYLKAEEFTSQQVFSYGEAGLFWKRMPKKTFITQEEKKRTGHTPMKDRLTLLLCSNARGDCKIKPLMVYHSETPSIFKKNNVNKNKLCVMWRANKKSKVTKSIFIEWMNEVFGPSVKKYLQDNHLPLKCLLVIGNTPEHPPDLEAALLDEEFSFITVKFLPPNATQLIQPMYQKVISIFKKLYTKAVFQRCSEVTSVKELSLKDFWQKEFNILVCISLIDKAWQAVTPKTMNSAWKDLWPGCVYERESEGCGPSSDDPTDVVQSIIDFGKTMNLKVSNEDVEELMSDHCKELTTEELKDLYTELQKTAVEDFSRDDLEETGGDVRSKQIKDILSAWYKVQEFVEKKHPDKMVAFRFCNSFNDNVLPHFRHILKRRQKQSSLDKMRDGFVDYEAGHSAKKPKKEVTSDT